MFILSAKEWDVMERVGKMRIVGWLLLLTLGILAPAAVARPYLPGMFSDHGVLQRGVPIRVWGLAEAGEIVRVRFHRQSIEAVASKAGLWDVHLMPESAGGPYTLAVTSDRSTVSIERRDILVGDVWFASGQSNMEMPFAGFTKSNSPVNGSEQQIAKAAIPQLRLLAQRRRLSVTPLIDTEDRWEVSSPEAARSFSAVAHVFGRTIAAAEGVPIGIITAHIGGTPAQSWISPEGIAWAGLQSVANDAAAVVRQQQQKYLTKLSEGLGPQGTTDAANYTRVEDLSYPNYPSAAFNGMIAPFSRYTIRGWLWYQGESDANASRPLHYSRVFSALIQDWRRQWEQGPLPFLYVQLSSLGIKNAQWGVVRDAQRRALDQANTGMAVTLDIGKIDNVHPPEKIIIGERLAKLARDMVYGHKVDGRSPALDHVSHEGGRIRAWLKHADGLKSGTSVIGDFEVAGEDGVFFPAYVSIEVLDNETTVIAHALDVPQPRYIRYGWNNWVASYLFNGVGLPLGTFTSDSDATMVTR